MNNTIEKMKEEQTINGLPEDWRWVKLGEVCKLKNGFAFKSTEYKIEGIPVIRISDIKSGLVTSDKSVRVDANEDYEEYTVSENEILVAMSGATTGKFGIFKSKGKAYQNQRVGKFQILDKAKLSNEFLLYQLHALKRKIEKDAYGGAQPNISSGKIEAMEILLPPKETQQQIVSKIEELFSELDKGIEELKTAQQQLKVYRQAVLKWAFEGKLTNEDVKDGELPEGWKWVRFGDCHEIKSNLVSPAEFQDVPHIAPDNISKGTAQLLEYRTIREDKVFSPKHQFFKGQILYSKIRPNLAKVIIAPFDGLCSADMYPIESSGDNLYTLYYMLTKSFVDKASNTESRTILPKINQKGLNEILFPLCSIEEQQQIVQEIESRLSVCDNIEKTITASLKQAEALRQSILKKAFEGKL